MIDEEENIVSQETPVAWDFDELAPELETISGHWGLSHGDVGGGSTGLRLVTRLGLRGLLANDRVRILPPLDLRPLDRPQLSFWVRHFNNALNHSLAIRIRTPDRGSWTEIVSRSLGERGARTDGYQQFIGPLTPSRAHRLRPLNSRQYRPREIP